MSDKLTLPIAEALTQVKKLARESFDATVELHLRLGIDPAKGEQQVRGSTLLPHGSGKIVRLALFVTDDEVVGFKKQLASDQVQVGGEQLIKQIAQSGKVDFDVAVASPSMMPKLAAAAKVLGPKGLMPSPKAGTVSPNPIQTAKELLTGRVIFRSDETGNLHLSIGKVSFSVQQLLENFQTALAEIRVQKPTSLKGDYIRAVYVASTMGKSLRVNL